MTRFAIAVVTVGLVLGPTTASAQQKGRDAQATRYARVVGGLLSGRGARRRRSPGEEAAQAALDKLVAFAAQADKLRAGKNGRKARAARKAKLDALLPLGQRAQAVRTVVGAYLAHRGKSSPFVAAVDNVRKQHGWRGKPALRKETDVLGLLSVLIDARLTQTAAPNRLRAHPAARVFPGAVRDGAPRIQRRMVIDTAIPRWHGTGLYVPPGEVVEVTVDKLPAGVHLSVIVGSHTDNIQGRPTWQRFPRISRRFRIAAPGSYPVANAFGGLLYVESDKRDAGKLEVTIKGAVAAPRFTLGKTSPDDWRRRIRNIGAPFGELECDRLVLTLPSAVLRGLDDPTPVLEFWTNVVRVQDELAHYDRESPERFVFDRQISAGYMHAGYPLMGPVSAAAKALDLDTLHTKGNWGMFHEIGHNHQTVHFGRYANPWTFDNNVEVTVNIFASYTYVAALKHPDAMAHQHWRTDILAANLKTDFGHAEYRKRSYKSRCLFWVYLIEEFGWHTLRAVLGTYARMPRQMWPRDDLGKRSLLLEVYSKQTGHDLAGLFAQWGLETTAESRARVAKLPAYVPKVALPAN